MDSDIGYMDIYLRENLSDYYFKQSTMWLNLFISRL